MLKDFNNEGKTIVIVTHDNYIAQTCSRVINILQKGSSSEDPFSIPITGVMYTWGVCSIQSNTM